MLRRGIEEYVTHLERQKRSPCTIDKYSYVLHRFADKLDDIEKNKYVFQNCVDEWSEHYSPLTVSLYVNIFSSYFEYLLTIGKIAHNYCLGCILPRHGEVLPKAVEEREVLYTIANADYGSGFIAHRDRAIIELGYAVAARDSDIVNALLSNLNLERQELKVTGKNNKESILMFGVAAKKALQKYLEERVKINTANDFLFITQEGGRLSTVYHIVKRLTGYGSHVFFRHSAATHMLERGADIRTIADILRHSSVNTTMIYTKQSSRRLREAYGKYHPRGS